MCPCEHGGATGGDKITIQTLTGTNVVLHEQPEPCVMEAARLFCDEGRLGENVWVAESIAPDGDEVTIGEFVSLLFVGSLSCSLHLSGEKQSDEGEFVLDVTYDFSPCRSCEGITTLGLAIPGIHDDTGGAAQGAQRQHCLNCYVHGGDVEGLEHDQRHTFAIGF